MPYKNRKKSSPIEIPKSNLAIKLKTEEVLKNIADTIANAELQIESEYKVYISAKSRNDLKNAKSALKTFVFMCKLKDLAVKFKIMLENVKTMQRLFEIIEDTNKIFSELMSFNYTRMFKDVKKNLKIFRKKISKYESEMDKMLDVIDNVFDDKPNPIASFFDKLFKKKAVSPADGLLSAENEAKSYLDGYIATHGGSGTGAGAAGAPVGGSAAAASAGGASSSSSSDDIIIP